jgi:hypothetical protein
MILIIKGELEDFGGEASLLIFRSEIEKIIDRGLSPSPEYRRLCMGRNTPRDERGIALIVALIILLVLTLIGISAISTTTFETSLSGNERVAIDAFYAAEAGLQRGISELHDIGWTPLGQGSSESKYKSSVVGPRETIYPRPLPGYSIEGGGGQEGWLWKVNGTGDSFGALKEIEVQVSVVKPPES